MSDSLNVFKWLPLVIAMSLLSILQNFCTTCESSEVRVISPEVFVTIIQRRRNARIRDRWTGNIRILALIATVGSSCFVLGERLVSRGWARVARYLVRKMPMHAIMVLIMTLVSVVRCPRNSLVRTVTAGQICHQGHHLNFPTFQYSQHNFNHFSTNSTTFTFWMLVCHSTELLDGKVILTKTWLVWRSGPRSEISQVGDESDEDEAKRDETASGISA